jgi:hypothetical protein
VDVYMSGHEHHQEHLRAGDLHQIVQGAAASLRPIEPRGPQIPAQQLFAAARYGFALLEISAGAINVEFFGYPEGSPHAFGSIYRATIPSRRSAAGDPR